MNDPVLFATVTPPENMDEAARKSLSQAGFARLKEENGDSPPSPRQVAREADFERYGHYPSDEVGADPRVVSALTSAGIIAAAQVELSPDGYRTLMLQTDLRPTKEQYFAALEAERAAKSG